MNNMKNILVCITNHNHNENAIKLKSEFNKHYKSIIIDSNSSIRSDEFDVKLCNVYYTGLWNESINQLRLHELSWLLFIASDVLINDVDKLVDIIESLPDEIGTWAPSSTGQSHKHCKPMNTNGYREVPYLEGFCFLSKKENLFYVDWSTNHLGYGIDIVLGYETYNNNKTVVVDDRISIYHKEGTGYDQSTAHKLMIEWMISNNYAHLLKAYQYAWTNEQFSLLKYIKKYINNGI